MLGYALYFLHLRCKDLCNPPPPFLECKSNQTAVGRLCLVEQTVFIGFVFVVTERMTVQSCFVRFSF
jgi:hypothetical protein